MLDRNDFEREKEKPIKLCPICREIGLYYKLGPKVIMPGETRSVDYENWLQCYNCGTVYGLYETQTESELRRFAETTTNPHNEKKVILGANPKRGKRKLTPLQKQFERIKKEARRYEDTDPEIASQIRKGLKVTVEEIADPADSNPHSSEEYHKLRNRNRGKRE